MKISDERLKELMGTNLQAVPFSITAGELAAVITEVMEWRANTSPNVQQPASWQEGITNDLRAGKYTDAIEAADRASPPKYPTKQCTRLMRENGAPLIPRTCPTCGLGPCSTT